MQNCVHLRLDEESHQTQI